ncbi:MAG: biotin/lipoyl-binding protein [Oscillospiraceae bacterium]|nr:biotin/lipoyl-binding protein [Oscillospiraceae bacterium]
MKRYTITVNGNAYDVTVDEADGSAPAAAAPAPKKAAPAKKAAAPAGAQGNASINAPMNGTIVDVKVKVGDKVSNGTVIAVLEAMKMENDIVSDKDGVVASINVNKGDSVETGAVVATLNA